MQSTMEATLARALSLSNVLAAATSADQTIETCDVHATARAIGELIGEAIEAAAGTRGVAL